MRGPSPTAYVVPTAVVVALLVAIAFNLIWQLSRFLGQGRC